eukprot:NODE_3_length_80033_cov_0.932970.p36 type:complete len:256 gc:universal NODE_3_length_80033_cov_0.932970:78317-77550(-)
MGVENLSYSAHSDSRGILELIQQSGATNIVLVHGSKSNMEGLKKTIGRELGLPCFTPAVGVTVTIRCEQKIPLLISKTFVEEHSKNYLDQVRDKLDGEKSLKLYFHKNLEFDKSAVLVREKKSTGMGYVYKLFSNNNFLQYCQGMGISKFSMSQIYWIAVNPGAIMDTFRKEFNLINFYEHLMKQLARILNLQNIALKFKKFEEIFYLAAEDNDFVILTPDLNCHERYKLGISFGIYTSKETVQSITNVIIRSCL